VLVILASLTLASCSSEPEVVEREVTRIVEVQVTAEAEAVIEEPTSEGSTLQAVRDRGVLRCGAGSGTALGFSVYFVGSWSGLNYDFCRAVAAAVLGDAEAVVAQFTDSVTRFPMLQSGEVDLLSNNTTWTLSRDTELGFNFAPTLFYDGQGIMVRAESGIESLEDLEGEAICVAEGTTSRQVLAAHFRQRNIEYDEVLFGGFQSNCAAYTTDRGGLVSTKANAPDPDRYVILPDVLSKEPLGPLVRHGDDQWLDIVTWSVNCWIQAEELGITSENVDEMLDSDNLSIRSTLGVEGNLGQSLGLENNFCYQIIKQVGNYGEVYDRNLGPDTAVNLPRGINALWTDGGLLYSPPFR
jgi:general L-amino acid transport system substrate-binding protein